jgi:hypothetical protein
MQWAWAELVLWMGCSGIGAVEYVVAVEWLKPSFGLVGGGGVVWADEFLLVCWNGSIWGFGDDNSGCNNE